MKRKVQFRSIRGSLRALAGISRARLLRIRLALETSILSVAAPQLSKGPSVYVQKDDFTAEPRPVTLGQRQGGVVVHRGYTRASPRGAVMNVSTNSSGATPETAASDIAISLRIVRSRNPRTTLLELIWVLGEITPDDAEVVSTALHMIRSGAVRLQSGPQMRELSLLEVLTGESRTMATTFGEAEES